MRVLVRLQKGVSAEAGKGGRAGAGVKAEMRGRKRRVVRSDMLAVCGGDLVRRRYKSSEVRLSQRVGTL